MWALLAIFALCFVLRVECDVNVRFYFYHVLGGAKHHRQIIIPQAIVRISLHQVYALLQLPTVARTL